MAGELTSEALLLLAGAVVFTVASLTMVLGLRVPAKRQERDLATQHQASLVRRRQAYLASKLPPVERGRVALPFGPGVQAIESASNLRALSLSQPGLRPASDARQRST